MRGAYLCIMLTIHRNHPLGNLNTFHVDSNASFFIETDSREELIKVMNSRATSGPLLILGGGSNILFTRDFQGTIIHSVNHGIKVVADKKEYSLVSAGAGTDWDDLVKWCVMHGLGGLENLSLIPGTVGASPVQNIGAYGTDAGSWIDSVEVVDLEDLRVFSMTAEECAFGYRDSIFKRKSEKKWLIWNVSFRLQKHPKVNLSYEALGQCFAGHPAPTPESVRQAVIRIRRSKLPDPAETASAGSFFKNPVIPASQAAELLAIYPGMPVYEENSQSVKMSAGWLIEQCGWKGFREGDVGVYPRQALVLVNYGRASGKEVLSLSQRIKESVLQKFGISLDPEVRII